jgi:hypothetical protein
VLRQENKKWNSSLISPLLQERHFLWSRGMSLCLPVSLASLCEPILCYVNHDRTQYQLRSYGPSWDFFGPHSLRQKWSLRRRTTTNNEYLIVPLLMVNLLHDRRHCERSDQKTSWRHFSSVAQSPHCFFSGFLWTMSDQNTSWRHFFSVDVAARMDRVIFFYYRIDPKENIVYAGVLQIFHTKNRWDIENFAFDACWYKLW